MKRLSVFILVIVFSGSSLYAQEISPNGYYIDALRFSQTNSGGSARISALGGSSIALGGDITAASSNPAGLGLYNRSEFSITLGATYMNNNTRFNGNKAYSQDIFAGLQNLGFVINNTEKETKGWLGGSFGFSVNKINDFNNEFRYWGTNNQNSIVDYFIESADGQPASYFPADYLATDLTTLAYYTYLVGPWNVMDETYPDDEYFSDVTTFVRPNLKQHEVVKTFGDQFQWSFSYGSNFSDFLYVGFGIGIVSLDYNAVKYYTESEFEYNSDDPYYANYDPISQINVTEDLNIRGTGFNSTFGFIFRPVGFFRVGGSITTPTIYQINDRYNADLEADWNDFFYGDLISGDTVLNHVSAYTADVASRYGLNTPLKASVGAAFFLGKLGFFTADIEYLNYGKVYLRGSEFSMDSDNTYMKDNFSESLNLKVGAELRFGAMRARAGYALSQVPLTAGPDYISPNQRFSAGFGVHHRNFFADFALINNHVTTSYSPYMLGNNSQPEIELKVNNFTALGSIGVKF
ncbi:MAG: hypothetical protein ABFS32_00730 [Bacteroidota bacterium]